MLALVTETMSTRMVKLTLIVTVSAIELHLAVTSAATGHYGVHGMALMESRFVTFLVVIAVLIDYRNKIHDQLSRSSV